MWIDAICMNQSDVQERTQQIIFMHKVYEKAAWTPVWLGEEDEETKTAIAAIQYVTESVKSVSGIKQEDFVGPDGFAFSPRALRLVEHDLETMDDDKRNTLHRVLEAVSVFFSRPWFKRVWVLQEVGSSARTLVWCGKHVAEWGSIMLMNFGQLARGEEYLHERFRNIPNWRSGILPQIWVGLTANRTAIRHPMLDLLSRVRQFKATDPRDIVYALLCLAKETSTTFISFPELKPDYSKSCSQIYADFTHSLIRIH